MKKQIKELNKMNFKININDKKSKYNKNETFTNLYYTKHGKGLIISELIKVETNPVKRFFIGLKLILRHLINN